ncbi:MAG: ABC transporter ATP-binding protein [Acidilobaceae archaeon]|nr:ABC transporter ATP-binding protein [Acidilobaceae archaeon]MCX8165175.1 ABC transporter ATP-binding protein [Acidilobaceae archaeon]MDW7974309.1 ABC transporter ATP-binding protein [Sulfolobales archaeon]
MEVLKVQGLKVWFPVRKGLLDVLLGRQEFVRAVDGVSFNVSRGETFCLVGESGCGKTTTARAIMMLIDRGDVRGGKVLFKPREEVLSEIKKLQPSAIVDSGYVDVLATRGQANKLIRREIQLIFQDPFGSINPRMRVYDVVEEPLIIHGIGSREEREEAVAKALEAVKLSASDFMYRFPHQLSGGQRQRVAIARTLVLNPSLLLADEPVSMLDVSIRAEILQVLDELKKTRGMSVIFITHDIALARYICDRIGVMYLGKIVEIARADEIVENPKHPYTKALISAVPDVVPENRKVLRNVPIKGEVPSAVRIPVGCRFRPRCVAFDENPGIQEKCRKEEPGLLRVGEEHYSACWLN